jgi:hypothetical protein
MIYGVMLVRNEADIIRANLLHHLASGIDHILVVDNGSTDGTAAVLDECAATGRVHVASRPGPFLQPETTTEFAREAFLRGARWVIPIDADEFWYAPHDSLREVLDDAAGAGALEVEVVNFIQRREQDVAEPRALLTMTRRAPAPIGTSGEAPDLVESGCISFVECRYPPKYVSRASIALQIAQGNHAVSSTDGPLRQTAAIVCLHAPLRARSGLAVGKAQPDRRVEEISDYLRPCWHLRRWRRLAAEGRLEAEWAANSYFEDALDVAGTRHPVTLDTRLRDVVAPWIEEAAGRPTSASGTPGVPARFVRPMADLDPAATAAIVERMRPVEGWLRDDEAELLVHVARQAAGEQDAAIVEIGSYCGKSTVVLASAASSVRANARVYAIDPHEGLVGAEDGPGGLASGPPTFERFHRTIVDAGLAGVVEAVRLRSFDVAWRAPIALLFVDGLHDYASVARDFFHFEPHLADGAFVAFHDCDEHYPGVQAFVAGLAGGGSYEQVARATSLVVFRRQPGAPPGADAGAPGSVVSLSRRVAQQQKGIAFLIGEIAARERIIRDRDDGIEWLRGVVRDKEATIAELEKGIDWLRKEIAERDRRD